MSWQTICTGIARGRIMYNCAKMALLIFSQCCASRQQPGLSKELISLKINEHEQINTVTHLKIPNRDFL